MNFNTSPFETEEKFFTRKSIPKQISSFVNNVSQQLEKAISEDVINLINKEGYSIDQLELCFYMHEPLRYSIRVGNKIIFDKTLLIEFTPTSEAYKKGYDAALLPKPRPQNPFKMDTINYDQWNAGYVEGCKNDRQG